jgi:hypothetical protein
VWYTVQRSGYPIVKVVIGERRANQLWAQSRKPLDCLARRRSYQRSRGTLRTCRSTRWATGGGKKVILRPTLWLLIILIIVKLSKQICDVPNRMCAGYLHCQQSCEAIPSPVNLLDIPIIFQSTFDYRSQTSSPPTDPQSSSPPQYHPLHNCMSFDVIKVRLHRCCNSSDAPHES